MSTISPYPARLVCFSQMLFVVLMLSGFLTAESNAADRKTRLQARTPAAIGGFAGKQQSALVSREASEIGSRRHGHRPQGGPATPAASKAEGPAEYRSRNFHLRTDLPAKEAKHLLKRLETMLGHMSRYWRRPNTRVIEIHVVKDLSNWPPAAIEEDALPWIQAGGGVTISQVQSFGKSFNAKAVVWAVSERGTPLHEAVHAYCAHAFGTTGPVWYSEGMAEIGQYWRNNDKAVNCGEEVIQYIRSSEPKSLLKIVDSPLERTGDSWQNYAWRWALCHLLNTNDNYRDRFRPLGLAMLAKKNVSFRDVYGGMAREISFEYLFFLEHLDRGFRTDLCRWDWKTKYRRPRSGSSVSAKIRAGRGWQPSRLLVEQDEQYEYSANGSWKTANETEAVDAGGDDQGRGRLVGVIFNDYKLGKPFELGTYGTFTASGSGNLLLRCRDEWNQMADNSGTVSVRLKVDGSGRSLPKPKSSKSAEASETPSNE